MGHDLVQFRADIERKAVGQLIIAVEFDRADLNNLTQNNCTGFPIFARDRVHFKVQKYMLQRCFLLSPSFIKLYI